MLSWPRCWPRLYFVQPRQERIIKDWRGFGCLRNAAWIFVYILKSNKRCSPANLVRVFHVFLCWDWGSIEGSKVLYNEGGFYNNSSRIVPLGRYFTTSPHQRITTGKGPKLESTKLLWMLSNFETMPKWLFKDPQLYPCQWKTQTRWETLPNLGLQGSKDHARGRSYLRWTCTTGLGAFLPKGASRLPSWHSCATGRHEKSGKGRLNGQ